MMTFQSSGYGTKTWIEDVQSHDAPFAIGRLAETNKYILKPGDVYVTGESRNGATNEVGIYLMTKHPQESR